MRKLVLVTGASSEIGAETIKIFAQNNYDVLINYNISLDKASELKMAIIKYNVNVYIEKFDITSKKDVQNIFDKYSIDILINNAGIAMDAFVFDKTKEEFMRVLEVNLYGTFLMCQMFLQRKKLGTIINVSSTDGIDTYNPLSIDYCASKAGIINMTLNLASYFKEIKICAICPNWVNTESVKEMDQVYLKEEMRRIGQKELIEPYKVANKIYEIAMSDRYRSGDIVRLDNE